MMNKTRPASILRSEHLLLHLTFNWPIAVGLIMVSALVAALIGYVLPRDYTAAAKILIDHNVAEALDTSNREAEATYLSRETVRLESLAYADVVWDDVRTEMIADGWDDLPVENAALFDDVFSPHPMDGVWQFVAVHPDQQYAVDLAGAWAGAFYKQALAGLEDAHSLEAALQRLATISAAMLLEDESQTLVSAAFETIETSRLLEPGAMPYSERVADYRDILLSLSFLEEEIPVFPEEPAEEELLTQLLDLADWLELRQSAGEDILAGLKEEQEAVSQQVNALDLQGMGISPYLEISLLQDSVSVDSRKENTGYMAVFGALIGVLLYVGWWVLDARKQVARKDGLDGILS